MADIYVDLAYAGGGSDGTITKPYLTVTDAVAAFAAANNADTTIHIATGTYEEAGQILLTSSHDAYTLIFAKWGSGTDPIITMAAAEVVDCEVISIDATFTHTATKYLEIGDNITIKCTAQMGVTLPTPFKVKGNGDFRLGACNLDCSLHSTPTTVYPAYVDGATYTAAKLTMTNTKITLPNTAGAAYGIFLRDLDLATLDGVYLAAATYTAANLVYVRDRVRRLRILNCKGWTDTGTMVDMNLAVSGTGIGSLTVKGCSWRGHMIFDGLEGLTSTWKTAVRVLNNKFIRYGKTPTALPLLKIGNDGIAAANVFGPVVVRGNTIVVDPLAPATTHLMLIGGDCWYADVSRNYVDGLVATDYTCVFKGCYSNLHHNMIRGLNPIYAKGPVGSKFMNNTAIASELSAYCLKINDGAVAAGNKDPDGICVFGNILANYSTAADTVGMLIEGTDVPAVVDYQATIDSNQYYVTAGKNLAKLDATTYATLALLQAAWAAGEATNGLGTEDNDLNSVVADPLMSTLASATGYTVTGTDPSTLVWGLDFRPSPGCLASQGPQFGISTYRPLKGACTPILKKTLFF
jgi:hypothetical protein